MSDYKSSKAFLLEGQILHQIKELDERLAELERQRTAIPKEINDKDYWAGFYMCQGAITHLMICLTCYDNPLSNFLSNKKLAKIKKNN